MYHLSSSWTIFFRLFLPVYWIVFFGSFALAMFLYRDEMGPVLGNPLASWIFLACYLLGIAFIYFTFWRLYRVDADNEFIYVTNYFKTYKYPFHQIKAIDEQDLLIFALITIRFTQRFSFGKRISFLANRKKLQEFLQENGEGLRHVLDQEEL